MYVKFIDIDPVMVGSPQGGTQLKEMIEPALAAGEVVELDFEGVGLPLAGFLVFSIGALVEKDATGRVQSLLRYRNLDPIGVRAIEGTITNAIRRREDPRWAEAMGIAALKLAERE